MEKLEREAIEDVIIELCRKITSVGEDIGASTENIFNRKVFFTGSDTISPNTTVYIMTGNSLRDSIIGNLEKLGLKRGDSKKLIIISNDSSDTILQKECVGYTYGDLKDTMPRILDYVSNQGTLAMPLEP